MTRHATTTCPTCSGSGHVPHAPGHYRAMLRYQDCTEWLDFPADASPQAVWRRARKVAAGDPSVNVTLIRPDGRMVGIPGHKPERSHTP